eukprot:scaffold283_cov186-Amphora_coffeaeformis.AAC.5
MGEAPISWGNGPTSPWAYPRSSNSNGFIIMASPDTNVTLRSRWALAKPCICSMTSVKSLAKATMAGESWAWMHTTVSR